MIAAQNPALGQSTSTIAVGSAKSLSERLFAARIDLVRALDEKAHKVGGLSEGQQAPYGSGDGSPPSEVAIQADALKTLQDTVTGLNLDNFIVRERRIAFSRDMFAHQLDA